MKTSHSFSATLLQSRWLLPAAVAAAVGLGWLVGQVGIVVPGLLVLVPLLIAFLVVVFWSPRIGFILYINYCFLLQYLGRHLPGVPIGLVIEGMLIITWLAVLLHQKQRPEWRRVQNDLCGLTLLWFVISVLEIVNPEASLTGWFFDMRSGTLFWLLTVPLGFLVFNTRRDLTVFLYLIIGFSVLGALYGIKQKVIGVDSMEQLWLNQGGALTHVIWGQLRIFSFYSEAAQFGASQAHIALVCGILALGPFSWPKKILLASVSLLLLYGMLISGTRGAFFVLVVGVFVYLILSKRVQILVLGILLAAGSFLVLKYTNIGNSNPNVYRMRSALDPNEPSLQVRLENQATLRKYLATRPFGNGLGTMGAWGTRYNADKFLSTIPPDSFFVKIWGQYGIIGFVIWFGIMLYILGKCGGLVWRTRDPVLRQKLLALTAGYAGILMCSYGNEIMNQMPSSVILYVSWVFVFLAPELDTPLSNTDA